MADKKRLWRKERLARTAELNEKRCNECSSVYPSDCIQSLQKMNRHLSRAVLLFSDVINRLLNVTPEMVMERLRDITDRFEIVTLI